MGEKKWAILGVVLLLAVLAMLGWYAWRALQTGLWKKELRHFYASPIAWLVMCVFTFVNGFVYLFIVDYFAGFAPPNTPLLQILFGNGFFWFTQIITIPAITMRLLSEEQASGTLEALMTAPVTDAEIVVSKYLAALTFYASLWVPTLAYILVAFWFGAPQDFGKSVSEGAAKLSADGMAAWKLPYVYALCRELNQVMDLGPVVTSYLGVLLMGSAWISVGLLTSALTRNQVVAFIFAFGFTIMTFTIKFTTSLLPSGERWKWITDAVTYLSFQQAYDPFPRGLLDTRSLIYFCSLAVLALFLTVRVLESRRWR